MSAGTGEDQAASAPATPEPATMVRAGDGSALPRAVRQHAGRRRNAAARDAILDVTFELLRTRGTTGLTVDAIAETAGVGRQTIYRWWPKGAVAAEAMARQARVIVPVRDTTSFPDDLTQFLVDSFTGVEDSGMRRALRQLVSAAQADEHVAEVLADFTAQRRAALRALLERGQASRDLPADADLDLLVDVAYGVLWYRLLIGHAPLDPRAARDLAAHLLAAGAAGLADAAQPSRPGEGG